MTTTSIYATLAEFKAHITNRGGTITADTADDAVIEQLLESASEYLDNETARYFAPYVQTRYFDVPDADGIDPRRLELDADLLEVLSVTNGDGTSIPSTEYNLQPKNTSPARAIRLKDNSTYYWASDGAGDTHSVIPIAALWGTHTQYEANAWSAGSTLTEDLDTSETSWTVADNALFSAGQVVRVGNELCIVSGVSTGAINVQARGANGSTAATHLTGAVIYIWNPMPSARNAALEIANTAYHRRFGQSLSSSETVTAAGVILSPRDVPALAQKFIETYRVYL